MSMLVSMGGNVEGMLKLPVCRHGVSPHVGYRSRGYTLDHATTPRRTKSRAVRAFLRTSLVGAATAS